MSEHNQKQSAGDGALNVQAGRDVLVRHGLSYSDARKVAIDVFRSEFARFSGEALDTARSRIEQFTEKAIRTLEASGTEQLDAVKDPDFQGTLFEAQRAAARHDDRVTSDLLVDTLNERAKERSRSRRQLVLNESVAVIGSLTPDELAAITLVFTLRHTKAPYLNSLQAFREYLQRGVVLYLPELPRHASAFQHLEYLRCGLTQVTEIKAEEVFRLNYPGLFSKGFLRSEHAELEEVPDRLLIPCFHEAERIQFNALDEGALTQELLSAGIPSDRHARLIAIVKDSTMSQSEVRALVTQLVPQMAELMTAWNEGQLKHFTLTAVGIAIGHANVRRVTGDKSELSIWIR